MFRSFLADVSSLTIFALSFMPSHEIMAGESHADQAANFALASRLRLTPFSAACSARAR